MRIVSLLPSTTEILFALGAGPEVVGRSADCDWPQVVRDLPVVSASTLVATSDPSVIDEAVRAAVAGGASLYRLDEDVLRSLAADVIVTQDLCAVCAVDVSTVDEAIRYLGCGATVVTIDPGSLDEVLDSVLVLGEATGHAPRAHVLVGSLRARLEAIAARTRSAASPRVLVLEWTEPPFGAGHWVPDLVDAAGAVAVLARPRARSVELSWDEVHAAEVDVVIVAPCGYHLEDAARLAGPLVRSGRLPASADVWAVDADAAFVRPGPRLVDGVEAIASIVHPSLVEPRPDLVRYIGTTSANTKPSRSTT